MRALPGLGDWTLPACFCRFREDNERQLSTTFADAMPKHHRQFPALATSRSRPAHSGYSPLHLSDTAKQSKWPLLQIANTGKHLLDLFQPRGVHIDGEGLQLFERNRRIGIGLEQHPPDGERG